MKLIRAFNRRVDRFLYRHPGFGIRNLMLYVVIGNVLVYLFSMMDRTGSFATFLAFSPDRLLKGEIWRLVTFVFIPSNTNLLFFALTLYFYYFIGSTLEREWGAGRFTVYYLLGMLLTVLYAVIARLAGGGTVYVSAGYLNLSMFFVFATLWPDNRVLLFFVIPVKMKWLACFNAALFVFGIISSRSLLPLVGILNYFLFCGDTLIEALGFLRMRRRGNVINFKRASQKIRKEAAERPYSRKCAVCGRTDTEHPELEFRYCSRCTGYHCFCIDHINNHIHFRD